MTKFFVGQRVRIVRSVRGRAGMTARIVAFGSWIEGDLLPCGSILGRTTLGSCNAIIVLDSDRSDTWPAHTDNLEPILDRHEPCESEFKESLDKLLSEVSREEVE